jgi:hypothetical protein
MGLNIFNVVEDPINPSPPQIYNWRLYFCTMAAAMGSAMFGEKNNSKSFGGPREALILYLGYDSAFIGGTLALTSFKRDFGLLDNSSQTIAALSAHIVSTCMFSMIS